MGNTATGAFAFTDIEGSTPRWEREPQAMAVALARHDDILHGAVRDHGGRVCKGMGDGVMAWFPTADSAIAALVAAQRNLEGIEVGSFGPLRVRMGIHLGRAEIRADDYFGPDINAAARLADAGHGGQVLVSDVALASVTALPAGVATRELGPHRLKGVADPLVVHQLVIHGHRDQFPVLRSEGAAGNLPQVVNRLVGREVESGELSLHVQSSRLVTVVGTGGVGKTRLALSVARTSGDKLGLTPWLVDLSAVRSDDEVAFAVANLFGVGRSEGRGLVGSVAAHLAHRPVLLVLDNCEHVLVGARVLASALVEAGPRARIVATSREPLGVAGEQSYVLAPLCTRGDADDPADLPAVALFCERAREVSPGFDLDAEGLEVAAELCDRLDGLPLAIELAAARVDVFGVHDILDHLEHRLSLRSRSHHRETHATLRATLDWSHRLLDHDHQALFRTLGVFVDSFDLDDALAVTGLDHFVLAELLADLVRKSLVVRRPGSHPVRFELLETTRDYALSRSAEAGDAQSVARAHAEHFLDLARDAGARLLTADALEAMDRGLLAYPEIRAALHWALEHDHDLALSTVLALPELWKVGEMQEEALVLLRAAEPLAIDRPADRADIESYLSIFSFLVGDYPGVRTHAEASIAASTEAGLRPRGRAVGRLALAMIFNGETEAGVDLARRELAYWRDRPSEFEACETIPVLHAAISFAGIAPEGGIDPAEEAIRLAEPFGPLRLGPALTNSAVALMRSEPERALELLERHRDLMTSSEASWSAGSNAMMRVMIYLDLGRWDEARAEVGRSIARIHAGQDPVRTLSTLEALALVLADDEPMVATTILVVARRERARIGTSGTDEELRRNEQTWTRIRHALGDGEVAAIARDHATTSLDEIVALAEREATALPTDRGPSPVVAPAVTSRR